MSQPLDYRSPPSDKLSPTRQKAARHARGNGSGCIFLSLCFGAAFSGVFALTTRGGSPVVSLLVAALFGLYVLAYLVFGILYIIASIMLLRPNAAWEKTLVVSASLHIGIVILGLLAGLAAAGFQGRIEALTCVSCADVGINLLIMGSLWQMIQLVRKLHQLGE